MLFALKIIVALVVLAAIVIKLYVWYKGKEEMYFEVNQRTKARLVNKTEDKLEFEIELPIHNEGKEEGIILDAFIRVYLPQEQYADARLRGRVNLKDAPRRDDYFEAMLLGPQERKIMVVKFDLEPEQGVTLDKAISGMPEVDVALFLDCRGRTALYTIKKIITLHKEEWLNLTK